jgi:hypothetical protein
VLFSEGVGHVWDGERVRYGWNVAGVALCGPMTKRHKRSVIGWREWVSLPQLGIESIKVKTDTGARTSALHAYDVHVSQDVVRFKVHPVQRNTKQVVACAAPLIEHREVRSSLGRLSLRPVIRTEIVLLEARWNIELTLVPRDAMGFRMLLGRQAIRGRFIVDPGRSYLAGRPKGEVK